MSFISGWFFVLAVFLVSSCVPGEENQVIIQPALTEEQITQIVNNKINQEIPKITDVCRNSVPVYIRDVANEGFLEEVKSYLTREGGKKLDMKTRTELDACKGSSERDICFFFTEIGKTPYNKIIKTIQKMANDVRPQVPLAKFAEFRPCDYPRGDMVFASVEAKPIVREKEKVAVDITLSLSEVSEETIIWLRFARGKGGFLDNLVREDDKRFSSGIEVGSGKKWTTSITGEVDKGELDG